MNLIKAYIYAVGIEQEIFRNCLRRDVTFMGFLPLLSPVSKLDGKPWLCLEEAVRHADENTFFLVSASEESALFESHGVSKERILVFYRMENLRCRKDIFLVIDKMKWLKEHLLRSAWAHASNEIKNRYFTKQYINKDIRLRKKRNGERNGRVVFLGGVNEYTEDYIKRLGESVWGIIAVDQDQIPPSLWPYKRQYADLFYEEFENLIFYVANEKIVKRLEGYLQEMGVNTFPRIFTYGRWLCRAGTFAAGGAAIDILDPLIGYTRRYRNLCGFQVFGFPNAPFRIITLGGSTSDPTLENVKSWSEILHDMLCDMGIEAAVYAGGIVSYNSAQECLKLLKDALLLQPTIIISYSGVNDAYVTTEEKYPFVRPYLRAILENGLKYDSQNKILTKRLSVKEVDAGVEDNSSCADIWLRNEKNMYAICKEQGIVFHAFLQAHNMDYCYYEALFGNEIITRVRMTYDKIRKYQNETDIPWLHDVTDIFDGESGIFYDHCHAYEKGNRIIARNILPIVLREMETGL